MILFFENHRTLIKGKLSGVIRDSNVIVWACDHVINTMRICIKKVAEHLEARRVTHSRARAVVHIDWLTESNPSCTHSSMDTIFDRSMYYLSNLERN